MYRSIVVPLDGSAFGRRAVPVALALARRDHAVVRLVHVHEPVAYAAGEPIYVSTHVDELRGTMRTDLTALAARLTQEALVQVDAEFLDGSVVPTLERYLAGRSADLVVMMTHGWGGVRRAWLGSVADGLVRQSPVPVLLVRAGAEWPGNLIEPLFRRVLVPLDGSGRAEVVLDHVVRLGGTSEATLYTLLTLVLPLPLPLLDYPEPISESAIGHPGLERQRDAALAYQSTVAEGLRQQGVRVETRVVVHPRAAEGILEEAEAQQADLIALATHGRGVVSRFFLGSVADKVVRGASMPLLVYRPDHATAAGEVRSATQ